jgi:hypothetical protein
MEKLRKSQPRKQKNQTDPRQGELFSESLNNGFSLAEDEHKFGFQYRGNLFDIDLDLTVKNNKVKVDNFILNPKFDTTKKDDEEENQ